MPCALDEIAASAPDTKSLELGTGVLERTAAVFGRLFPDKKALVVGDPTTFAVAGRRVLEALQRAGSAGEDCWIFGQPDFHAGYEFVHALEDRLRERAGLVPVAVGSGTINDVTKLAAHQAGRRYLTVATAASMDGYTAFGASITRNGAKKTFPCAAPLAVIADLEVIGAAPLELTAAGYADLLAKVTAGADWILADALGVEDIHRPAWDLVQGNLRSAVDDPSGVRARNPQTLRRLTEGLLLSGFAMQLAGSSRPASGAEHQFSHLWDMQHHTHRGAPPLHGFKVGIGTLAVAALHEYLLNQPFETLDPEVCCAQWPSEGALEQTIRQAFAAPDLARVAAEETRAKYLSFERLGEQLRELRQHWPVLRERVRQQLLTSAELKQRLHRAGAPVEPQGIGLTPKRLRDSFRMAYFLRRRFTVLDLAVRTGTLQPALDSVFGPSGPWPQTPVRKRR